MEIVDLNNGNILSEESFNEAPQDEVLSDIQIDSGTEDMEDTSENIDEGFNMPENTVADTSEIAPLASASGKQLRVTATKTSAQGKAAQSATPNLMSFSTDENSIWFNGKKYGVYVLKGYENISTDSDTSAIQSFLGDFTYDKWKEAVNAGSIVYVTFGNILIPAIISVDTSDSLAILFSLLTDIIFVNIQYSADNGYSIIQDTSEALLGTGDIVNTLNDGSIDKPLSAAMGKKLNDAIYNIKIKIFESLSGREGDNVADVLGKLTDDWNMHPEKYIFYIKDDSEMCIAPCTVYYEANMRYLSYQVNGTIYEYDCEYDGNDICNLLSIYVYNATPG